MNFFLCLRNYRGFLLRDLGSKHGTFVNGKRIGVKDGSSRTAVSPRRLQDTLRTRILLCVSQKTRACAGEQVQAQSRGRVPERTAVDNAECKHDAAAGTRGRGSRRGSIASCDRSRPRLLKPQSRLRKHLLHFIVIVTVQVRVATYLVIHSHT